MTSAVFLSPVKPDGFRILGQRSVHATSGESTRFGVILSKCGLSIPTYRTTGATTDPAIAAFATALRRYSLCKTCEKAQIAAAR